MNLSHIRGTVILVGLVVFCSLAIGYGVHRMKRFFLGGETVLPAAPLDLNSPAVQQQPGPQSVPVSTENRDVPKSLVAVAYYFEGARFTYQLQGGGAIEQWVPDERGVPVAHIPGKFGSSISYRCADRRLTEYWVVWKPSEVIASLPPAVSETQPAPVIVAGAGPSDTRDEPVLGSGVAPGALMRGLRR